jgi:class 3 adenylate cyclase
MEAVSAEIAVVCKSPARALWGVLTDTERLNRMVGMSKLSTEPIDDASAARYLVSTRLGGFSVKFEELPFEWAYPESYRILRRMRNGPLEVLEMAYHLVPLAEGGTRVEVTLTLTPRYRILSPFLGLMADRTLASFRVAILALDAELASGKKSAERPELVNEEALARAATALRQTEPEAVVDALTTLLREGADVDVGRIRPFALADEWGRDRREILRACLGAVRAGLLDLHWEVVCPSCRTATQAIPSLASLTEHGACQLCEIQFAVDLDEAVEASFTPSPAVRAVDLGPYCIGGPSRTPHVLAQALLPPAGEARLKGPAEPGQYRLFLRGGVALPVEIREGAPAEQRATRALLGPREGPPAPLLLAPAGTLVVENPGAGESHAKLERVTWSDQAARARVVMTMPGFRRDFSGDILRPGMALKVARVGIFFSDLTGSTQLYTDAGDAAAFKLVHDHFEVVIGLIEKSGGSLVKTIGDAVMAVFADDLDGLIASVAILHAFEDFRAQGEHRGRTHIKLGVFGGPCYAVTANERLDYFGQTVNLSARLQAEARSGELVVPEELCDRALAARAIPASFVRERYAARLKGVTNPLAVARIKVGK